MNNPAGAVPRPDHEQQRVVLIHYHLFKNAGTSVDRALKSLYGTRWGSIEADSGDGALAPEKLQTLIDRSPELVAISSHTAEIKPWALRGVQVLPVVFVRHPIDRMMSAYEFERKQQVDTLGARRAKELSFPQYADLFVRRTQARTFRSFQTYRIAQASLQHHLPEIERALDALTTLPFVGVVENYETSITRLERIARPLLPELKLPVVRANASERTGSLHERLDQIRELLGPELYSLACDANLADLVLWERARYVQFQDKVA